MSVHIGRLTSEVIPEPEGAAGEPQSAGQPEQQEQVRRAQARWIRDMSRTAAEGFDD